MHLIFKKDQEIIMFDFNEEQLALAMPDQDDGSTADDDDSTTAT